MTTSTVSPSQRIPFHRSHVSATIPTVETKGAIVFRRIIFSLLFLIAMVAMATAVERIAHAGGDNAARVSD